MLLSARLRDLTEGVDTTALTAVAVGQLRFSRSRPPLRPLRESGMQKESPDVLPPNQGQPWTIFQPLSSFSCVQLANKQPAVSFQPATEASHTSRNPQYPRSSASHLELQQVSLTIWKLYTC